MECPVCLGEGGEPCLCGRPYHASCVYNLLQSGFECCQNCFTRFTPALFLLGARHAAEIVPSPLNAINLAAALTGARKGNEALRILHSIGPQTHPLAKAAFSIEMGRALLQLCSPTRAARHLRFATCCARRAAGGMELYTRALAFLCRAHCDLGDDGGTRMAAAQAFRHTSSLHFTDAICIMRTLADCFQAKGCDHDRKIVLETICEITDVEHKDPFAKAAAHADLGIAEGKLGIDSSTRLKSALRTLRKRPHIITAPAAACLASQVRPAKRLRGKMHPEDIE
jgi:hypothetical protein